MTQKIEKQIQEYWASAPFDLKLKTGVKVLAEDLNRSEKYIQRLHYNVWPDKEDRPWNQKRVQGTMQTTCNRCKTMVEGKYAIEEVFGWRSLDYEIPQGWCKKCRSNYRKETANSQ